MEAERPTSRQANEDLGLGAFEVNVLLGQVRRRVLGIEHPAKLGRYELLRRLGAGAMGVVYLARDPRLDREIAIKHLHPQIADSPNAALAERRMQREAWAMARLTHPNVVAVYEFGAEGDQFFIVMEYVPGITLRAWMDAEPERPWPEVLELFIAAGQGLASAHDASLIHRDFKPQNVLIDTEARVAKVTDFGLASSVGELARFDNRPLDTLLDGALDDDSLALSTDGVVLGTPAYMAPECHAGQAADARSDQFSFCVALYEALFGERPFVGSSYAELARAVQAGQLRPAPRARSVPPWIVAVLERGLAVEPERRWPSMSALLEALCDDPRIRHRRRVWTLAAVAFVAVLVGGSALVERGHRARRIASCTAEGQAIAEVWNPNIRARMEASGSLDRAESIDEAIDEYAQQWSDTRTKLCVAAEIDHSLDPELARRARQCLDTRRSWMGLLVEVFPELEGAATLRAGEFVMHLPELTTCLDPAYLRGLPELPEIHEQAQRELSTTLLRAELERSLHRFDESVEIGEAALADAEALGWPPLIVEATFELGRTYARMGRPELGAQLTEEAYFAAVEHELNSLAVHSATFLAMLSVEVAEAERWMRHARAALNGIERPAAELLGHFDRQSMMVAMRSGADEHAVEIGEALLPRAQAQLGDGHPSVQDIRKALGFAYLHLGRVEDAIAMFETALAVERRRFGTEGLLYVPMLVSLAEAKLAAGHGAQAQTLLEQALPLREAVEGPVSVGVAGMLAMLGRACEDTGQLEAARTHYARDLAIHRQLSGDDHPVVGVKHERQARILIALGERTRALEHLEAAVDVRVSRANFDAATALLDARALAVERCAAGEIDEALALYAAALDSDASLMDASNDAAERPPPPPWTMPHLEGDGPRPPPRGPGPRRPPHERR